MTLEQEILTVLAPNSQKMTYVIANSLRMDYPKKHNGKLSTTTVRRCLERMEKTGIVRRVSSVYVRQICWQRVEAERGER